MSRADRRRFVIIVFILTYASSTAGAMRWRIRAKLTRDIDAASSRTLRDDVVVGGARQSVTIYLRADAVPPKIFRDNNSTRDKSTKLTTKTTNRPTNKLFLQSIKSTNYKNFDPTTVKFLSKTTKTTNRKLLSNRILTTTISTTPTTASNKTAIANTVADWAHTVARWRRPPAAVLDIFSRSFNLSELLAWRRLVGSGDSNQTILMPPASKSTMVLPLTTTVITTTAISAITSIASAESTSLTTALNTVDGPQSDRKDDNFLALEALEDRSTRPAIASLRAALVRTATRPGNSSAIRTADWRFYNHCSGGYLTARTFDAGAGGWTHARGRAGQSCLIDWRAHFWSDGTISLETLARRRRRLLLCANAVSRSSHIHAPQQFALRRWTPKTQREARCRFREHLTRAGYSILENSAASRRRLGFDRRGRQLADDAAVGRRCYHFSRVDIASAGDICRPATVDAATVVATTVASTRQNPNQGWLREIARDALLRRIEI